MPHTHTLRMLKPRRRQAGTAERHPGGPQARLLTQLPEVVDGHEPSTAPTDSCPPSHDEGDIVACLGQNRQTADAATGSADEWHESRADSRCARAQLERWVYRGGGLVSIGVLLYLGFLNLHAPQAPGSSDGLGLPVGMGKATLSPASDRAGTTAEMAANGQQRLPATSWQINPADYPSTGLPAPGHLAGRPTRAAEAGIELNPPTTSYELILHPQDSLKQKYQPAEVGLSSTIERIRR